MATGSQIDEADEQLQRKKDPKCDGIGYDWTVGDSIGRSIKKQEMVDAGLEGGWMEGLTARAPLIGS
jgi:hypothetical protein